MCNPGIVYLLWETENKKLVLDGSMGQYIDWDVTRLGRICDKDDCKDGEGVWVITAQEDTLKAVCALTGVQSEEHIITCYVV